MKVFCQFLILAYCVLTTCLLLWRDMVTAHKDGPEMGCVAMFVTAIASAAMMWCVYGAGAMSELIP